MIGDMIWAEAIPPQMKRLTTIMLGLSLALGCVTPTFAGDDKQKPKKAKKVKKHKRGRVN